MWYISDPKSIPQPIQEVSTVQLMPLGRIVQAYEPLLGAGEFIYLPGVASTAVGNVVTYDLATSGGVGSTTRYVASANAGHSLAVAMSATVASTWGWYQIGGQGIALSNATHATGVVNSVGTSTVTSSATTGMSWQGTRIIVAGNSTFTKTCTSRNGSTLLIVPDFNGLFVGLGVSGTGLTTTTIAAGSNGGPNAQGGTPGGSGVINLAAAATADGTVTVTFTRTNFPVLSGHRYMQLTVTA